MNATNITFRTSFYHSVMCAFYHNFANAGVAELEPIGAISEEHFDKHFDLSLF